MKDCRRRSGMRWLGKPPAGVWCARRQVFGCRRAHEARPPAALPTPRYTTSPNPNPNPNRKQMKATRLSDGGIGRYPLPTTHTRSLGMAAGSRASANSPQSRNDSLLSAAAHTLRITWSIGTDRQLGPVRPEDDHNHATPKPSMRGVRAPLADLRLCRWWGGVGRPRHARSR